MEREKFIQQWREVKAMTEGKTIDEIRQIFGKNITNDFMEMGFTTIDTNYKDILVTFTEINGKVVLLNDVECYNEYGVFIDLIFVKKEERE